MARRLRRDVADTRGLIVIASPFLYNIWKHHLQAIRQLRDLQIDHEELLESVATIGARTHDIYIGALGVDEVTEQLGAQLKEQNVLELEEFQAWLGPMEHRSLTIDDESVWVMRLGEMSGRHLHIHPARHTPHSVRFNAPVWKTATLAFFTIDDRNECDLEAINRLRKDELDLSPIAQLTAGEGISKALDLIYDYKI
ncbi:MAG: hypothetical protein AAF585_05230 [Verrucomicrobiota bacterium]